MSPIKVSSDSYVSLSMGALWTVAGGMIVGIGLLCVGIRQGQQFIDAFQSFEKSTLTYEKEAEQDRLAVGIRLANITSWQLAADERRKIVFPTLVNGSSMGEWLHALERKNSDLLRSSKDKMGLTVPPFKLTPQVNLPEAIVVPLIPTIPPVVPTFPFDGQ